MADLKTRIENLATAIATRAKADRTMISGNAATLAALQTAAKDNLVNAINELQAEITALGTPATINDASAGSLTQTYSVTKILQLLIDVKAEILGGALAAQDTLAELKAYVDSGAAADVSALANRLRVDVNNQGLTAPQQANGQDNLSVYSRAQIGNPDTDFSAVFATGLL
jgi:hypothetical protein